MGTEGEHPGAADFEDELLPQLLPHGVEGVMELLETAPAQGSVGGPVGVVEGPSCRPMARCMSSTEASATWPSSSSVAGFTFPNVRPRLASTSSPSISILGSGCTLGASVVTR